MKQRPNLFALINTLVYWIPSTIVVFSIVESKGSIFPKWLNIVLAPGYALSLFLGFFGGKPFILLGQLISLIVVFLIARYFIAILKSKR